MMNKEYQMGWVDNDNMAMLIDLYELTMAYSYFRSGKNDEATFELFIRSMPENRSFLISAGLEQILFYLENMRFGEKALEYLRGLKLFDSKFIDYLRTFTFNGNVYAIAEGEIYFPPEPVIVVTASRIEAQIIETFLLNTFNFQSLIASKAARICLAAQGRPVVDFSSRRDHGADAAVKAARASYIGGCIGTSNTLAGMLYGVPVYGTMAHSYVMSYENELESFRQYSLDYPDSTVLLIDTYNVMNGGENAVTVAKEMEKKGCKLKAVRIDSGDLQKHSADIRKLLDTNGLSYVKVMASGDLNEYKIARLIKNNAPIDSFGVGTEMGTSKDCPALGGVYKLSHDGSGPKMKTSEGKTTIPGKKSVVRFLDNEGKYQSDMIVSEENQSDFKGGYKLLQKYIENGKIIRELPTLDIIRAKVIDNLAKLPISLKNTNSISDYVVKIHNEVFN